jgi:cell division protein FtsA
MFATSVGLVLSGFKALDFREMQYQEMVPAAQRKKDRHGANFFKDILEKTKGLLIDDFDDRHTY